MENPDEPTPRPFPVMGPGMRIWLLIALYFALLLFISVLARAESMRWIIADPNAGFPVNYARLGLALQGLAYAIPVIVYANIFPFERFSWLRLTRPPLLASLSGVAAMIASIFGLLMLYNLGLQFVYTTELKEFYEASKVASRWLMAMPTAGDLIMVLLTSAVAPAVCEELFFRGGIQQVTAEWTRKPVLSIVISAAFFTLVHSDVAGFAMIFIYGLMLGYAFHRTRSLWTPIIMHFCFNATEILVDFFSQRSPAFRAWEPSMALSIAGLVVAAGFMFLLHRLTRGRVEA